MPHPFPSAPRPRDHAAIEAALCSTEAGRSFLAEHAERCRRDETLRLLGAVASLEASRAGRGGPATVADDVAAVRRALAGAAGGEPSGVLGELARALARILRATESLQDLGWTMRERGFDRELCDALERGATDIYAGCGAHETGLHRLIEQVGALDAAATALRETRG